jgi:hypothetical protein
MNRLIKTSIGRFLLRIALTVIALMVSCFALSPGAHAVVPAPDGGYAGGNTAEGQNALLSLTTGGFNTAVGWSSLRSNITGQLNTAIGAGTLVANTADLNTATGGAALFSNTTGANNTANGALALLSNTTGNDNTADGSRALFYNTTGSGNNALGGLTLFHNLTGNFNTAIGDSALESNTSGDGNVAIGADALTNNFDGLDNTAIGGAALASNRDSGDNTAVGFTALQNSTGGANTAVGSGALGNNTTGGANTALGNLAGSSQTTGTNNVYIGAAISGVAGESDTCRIRSIFGQTAANGSAVFITSGNKLGTDTSSKRFKEAIKPMDKASEALLSLKPVTFRYRKEIDPEGKSQFGLVAEEVEKVNPNLVVRDEKGRPYSVRYEQVNAMLLNEFLKEHKTVRELKATAAKQEATIARQREDFEAAVAEQKKEIQALTATTREQAEQIQKVSARLEVTEPRSRTVLNNPQSDW